jgi:hypothetical protein
VSQIGVAGVPAQSASSVQPGTQVLAGPQIVPIAQCVSSVHSTQLRVPVPEVAQMGAPAVQPLSRIPPLALSSQGTHALAPPELRHAGAAAVQPRSRPPIVVSEQG